MTVEKTNNDHSIQWRGFKQLDFRSSRMSLYELEQPIEEKIESARQSILSKCKEGYRYHGELDTFAHRVKSMPYLVIRDKKLRLASHAEVAYKFFKAGEKHQRKENDDRALKHFHKCLEIASKFNDKELMSKCNNKMGRICMCREDYAQAVTYFTASVEIAKGREDHESAGLLYLSLGECHGRLGEVEDALQFTQLAKRLGEQMGDEHLVAKSEQSLDFLGRLESYKKISASFRRLK